MRELPRTPGIALPPRPSPDRPPIAVALHYDRQEDKVPRVVASGRGALAERILALAFAHGVKVREDADLAEILAAVEIGQQIPIAAFVAVAEILFYLYRANERQAAAAAGGAP
ncbi:MAG TPA: EscU/YscU/HrcU family type III secretion system export apparatus switch protein [Stellaceae bacterium]|nr:EscU/YscU/HrcU family type III secretion system export apparatus switch protein [Stellaceae bacterium]